MSFSEIKVVLYFTCASVYFHLVCYIYQSLALGPFSPGPINPIMLNWWKRTANMDSKHQKRDI